MEVVVLVEGLAPVAIEGLLGDPLGVVVGVPVPRHISVRVGEDEELLPLELLLRDVQGSTTGLQDLFLCTKINLCLIQFLSFFCKITPFVKKFSMF